MELKKKIISFIVIPFIVGLAVNLVYDQVKSHSSTVNRKSGYEFEFNFEIKFKKTK